MNKKGMRLFEPGLRLYFLFMLLFAAASAFFSPLLAAIELFVLALLFLYLRAGNARKRKELLHYIESITYNMDAATRDTMANAPLPMVIFRPETGEVIWGNDLFLNMTGEREHMFDTRLADIVPEFDARWLMEGKNQCPSEVEVDERRFLVFGHLVRTQEQRGQAGILATTYWVEITEYSALREEYYAARPAVAILQVDNYEELMKNTAEDARASVLAGVNTRLNAWVEETGGLFCRYDRDHYLLVLEDRDLTALQEGKFSVLDTVREVQNPAGIQATLSIGVGRDAPTLRELFQYAALAIEMALSRGGDQAVLKNQFSFEFYGGRSKELEKRTKVKSRVMANALSELLADASRVFVMGHKFPDLDAVGAAAGVCAIARKREVPAYFVYDTGHNPGMEMTKILGGIAEYEDRMLTAEEAIAQVDKRSVLVVVDTNRPEQVLSEALLEHCDKVAVIDHHRRAATYIADAALNFHEPYASSASELVTELISYIMEPGELLRVEAEALLAGIVLDTKNFTMRTGTRTFEAAAFLRRAGADTAEVRKLFQNDLEGTISRYDIIQNAKMYRDGVAVAAVGHTVSRVTAAQAADELLNIYGIDTSFVLFPLEEQVIVSARSTGEVNVQVILETVGGGGNAATAGAQIPGKTLEEATDLLLAAIDGYFDDE